MEAARSSAPDRRKARSRAAGDDAYDDEDSDEYEDDDDMMMPDDDAVRDVDRPCGVETSASRPRRRGDSSPAEYPRLGRGVAATASARIRIVTCS